MLLCKFVNLYNISINCNFFILIIDMSVSNDIMNSIFEKLFRKDSSMYIFVYTLPKVGSTTLVTSLRISLGRNCSIIHVHDENMLRVLSGINTDIKINDLINYIAELGKKVYIIDIYRTPVERKISEYFDKLSFHFNNTEEMIIKYDIDRIINRFNKIYPYLLNDDYYMKYYNIPIVHFPEKFDYYNKCMIHTIKNKTYVKLRLKDSALWGYILSGIFNYKIVIVNDYLTSERLISSLYDKFKHVYKLPKNYVDNLSNDDSLKYYYNTKEREEYLNSWKLKEGEIESGFNIYEYNMYMKITCLNSNYDKIQMDHYLDEGCICKICSNKRKKIYLKALEGVVIKERIMHNENISEYQTKCKQIEEQLNMRRKKVIQKNKIQTNILGTEYITKDKVRIDNLNMR